MPKNLPNDDQLFPSEMLYSSPPEIAQLEAWVKDAETTQGSPEAEVRTEEITEQS